MKEIQLTKGFISAFDITGYFFTPRYYGRDPQRADYEALRGDWEAVGLDMRRVMRRFEIDHAEELAGQQRLFDPENPID